MPQGATLTDRQQKWFASVREGLERCTGKTVEQWAEIAQGCPETAHRRRLAWMKATHGLGQNHASMILDKAFPPETSWSEHEDLEKQLWIDPAAYTIFAAIREAALALPDVIVGQRRGFTAFSRNFQFAAARPAKGGVLLGLALDADGSFFPRNTWSERLKVTRHLSCVSDVDEEIVNGLHQSWARS